MKKPVKRLHSFRCTDAMWEAVESAAGGMGMSVNEFVLDSLKRNIASPLYEVDKKRLASVERVDILDRIDQLTFAMTQINTGIKQLKTQL